MTNELSIWSVVMRADPVVQGTMLVLVLASVLTWGIAIQKFLRLRAARQENEGFIEAFWASNNMDEVYRSMEGPSASPVAQVFRAGYREMRAHDKGKQEGMKGNLGILDNIQRAMRKTKRGPVRSMKRGKPKPRRSDEPETTADALEQAATTPAAATPAPGAATEAKASQTAPAPAAGATATQA